MGYFSKQVGRPLRVDQGSASPAPSAHPYSGAKSPFSAQVGKSPASAPAAAVDRCPRCRGALAAEDGCMRCVGRCRGRWVAGGPGRWLDPATLPFGACGCCSPRVPLVRAEVGAICPASRTEYLVLPEGIIPRAQAAPLGICRCCLPPQPLVQGTSGLVCRNKPQQHYQVIDNVVTWIGSAPGLDQVAVTAAIDAALRANCAELTLFGLFAPPAG